MMNHTIKSVLSVLLLLVMALSLSACAGGSNDLSTVTLEEDEFRYTLRSDRLEYSADELDADKPFHVTLAISYTGDQDSISLWCVDDTATAKFMSAMYEKVVKKGMDYVTAYQKTKTEFRKNEDFDHPYYWAAFVLYE